MIFPSCALFWKEVLAHAAPRVSSLASKAVPPRLSHSLPALLSLSLQNGNTALAIAKRLGYISVVDTLKVVTEEVTTTTTVSTETTDLPGPILLVFPPHTLRPGFAAPLWNFLCWMRGGPDSGMCSCTCIRGVRVLSYSL